MPYESISELPDAVRTALPVAAQKIYLNVFNSAFGDDCDDACASKQAWSQAKKSLGNLVELHSVSNAITGTHDAVLQRLDTLIKNNGRMIHYSAEAFQNVGSWVGVPVIYAMTEGEPLHHPKGTDVMAGNIPDGYRVVGRVASASLGTGEPTLRGQIEIDDPELDMATSAGEMSLSTGFAAQLSNVDGQEKLVGSVVPNHVLIFRRGACRNCYPNDNSARFENVMEATMDEETKGFFTKLVERIENLTPNEAVKEEIMPDNTEEIKNLTEERDAALKELEELRNAAEQQKKDAAWTEMKNILPEGWLGEKEAETRAEFETAPAAFSVKLAKFTAENGAPAKQAEGNDKAGKVLDAENLAKAEVEQFEKESGLYFF